MKKLIGLLLLIIPCACEQFTFLSISDIHYDPLFDVRSSTSCQSNAPSHFANTASYGCDSPLSLVQGAIGQLAMLDECPELILITGDLIRHHLPYASREALMVEIFSTIQQTLYDAFPNCSNALVRSPLLAIGNNDLQPRYPPPPPAGTKDQWLVKLSENWDSIANLSAEQLDHFQRTGFYRYDHSEQLVMLVIHTNYWGVENTHVDGTGDPVGGFAWLAQELARAQSKGQSVWIVGHIPMGVDYFSLTNAWYPLYNQKFRSLVSNYSPKTIKNVFFGHEHATQVRAASDNEQLDGSLLHGALSPVYGNNPVIRRYTARNSTVVDYGDYVYALGDPVESRKWTPMYDSFLEEYQVANLRASTFEQKLAKDPTLEEAYVVHTRGDVPTTCTSSYCLSDQRCVVIAANRTQWNLCSHPEFSIGWLVVGVVVAVTVVTVVIVIIACYFGKRRALRDGHSGPEPVSETSGLIN